CARSWRSSSRRPTRSPCRTSPGRPDERNRQDRWAATDEFGGAAGSPSERSSSGRKETVMRKVIVVEWMTLDGVVQAPGAADEDTSGGFQHGGWDLPYFDEPGPGWGGGGFD